jgi:acyl-CoA reductase-like NAD-dependent aldehyde dehydrogenase
MRTRPKFLNLINGHLEGNSEDLPVVDPSTGEEFARVPVADKNMLDRAVLAAGQAANDWQEVFKKEGGSTLKGIASILRMHSEDLARLLTREQGKPITAARSEVEFSADLLDHYADLSLPAIELDKGPDTLVEQIFEPLGVVAGIVPWNFPLLTAIMKIAPALATGNAIIVKPAPTTPLATLHFGELIADFVMPGLIQILADDGTLGPEIVTHPDINMISFTGSTTTGKKVMASAAATLKRLNLELGGNDPAIVFEDVDVDSVAQSIIAGAFINSGQVCTAIKRLYVHEEIYASLCDSLCARLQDLVVGSGLDESVTLGPVQNSDQYGKLIGLIDDSRKNGRILHGGDAQVERKGFFIPPTLVADLKDSDRLVREEQFGPVLPILSFKTESEVIERANDTEYGLSASVWTNDKKRANRVARQIDAGTVWINKHLDLNPDYPFSPCKQSGIGVEFGVEGMRAYTQARVISQ